MKFVLMGILSVVCGLFIGSLELGALQSFLLAAAGGASIGVVGSLVD